MRLITLSINDLENKYISDIKPSDIIVNNYNSSLYQINLLLSSDENLNTLTVNYHLSKASLTSSSLSYTFRGFKEKEIKNEIISTLESSLTIKEEGQYTFDVSLKYMFKKDTYVNITCSNNEVSVNTTSLLFTKTNYDQVQKVIITANKNSEFVDKTSTLLLSSFNIDSVSSSITIKNTDIYVPNEIAASLTSLELDENSTSSIKVNVSGTILDSISVSLKTDKDCISLSSSNLTFTSNNRAEQTVTITSTHLPLNYEDLESKITITINETISKTIKVTIKNIDLEEKYEIITPVKDGFITAPLYYYTAYYDVDFKIKKMFVELDNSGVWKEIKLEDFNSFTSSACMFELPDEGTSNYLKGIFPSVKLKAYYDEKVTKLEGTPTFELDSYRIKATLGDYVEYFLLPLPSQICLLILMMR